MKETIALEFPMTRTAALAFPRGLMVAEPFLGKRRFRTVKPGRHGVLAMTARDHAQATRKDVPAAPGGA